MDRAPHATTTAPPPADRLLAVHNVSRASNFHTEEGRSAASGRRVPIRRPGSGEDLRGNLTGPVCGPFGSGDINL
jgi:hypothetical protein